VGEYQLAQVNVAKAIDDLDSVALEGFVNRLDEINALADDAPGFVWRLIPDDNDHSYIRGYEDPRMIVNISVWENIDDLKNYVYRSTHLELIQQKKEWFEPIITAHMALWWVPIGTQPSEKDGVSRLDVLTSQGPSAEAFTFSKPWPSHQT